MSEHFKDKKTKKVEELILLMNLLGKGEYSKSMIGIENDTLKGYFDEEVNSKLVNIYLNVIKLISEGKSEEEIIKYIDEIDLESFNNEKQNLIKNDVKNTLILRKNRMNERNDK